MPTCEFNFDGLIGPSHNYAGLSFGNVASSTNQYQQSNPKAAALQGLQKMKFLHDLGIAQAILPPLRRPRLEFLRELGFSGSDSQVLESAANTNMTLVHQVYSASNMWTANAATVSPSVDCEDSKVHFTPANLASTLHRSIEPESTLRNLRFIFSDPSHFKVHPALPSQTPLSDEGAANHTRFCRTHSEQGVEFFVFGVGNSKLKPEKFPARQTELASQAIARRHGLKGDAVEIWQQNPNAIDAGVFHNDVISVGNEDLLLCHELAFVNQPDCIAKLQQRFRAKTGSELKVVQWKSGELQLREAVQSYLFNSQIVTRADGKMTLICPLECDEIPAARRATEKILAAENRVDQVQFLDLRQSMNNGGGPACLRLRVVLTEEEQQAIHQGVIFSDDLFRQLANWIDAHYRDTLIADDLRDYQFARECFGAIESLADILGIPRSVLLDE
ncbi:MAG: N-succinylarginine dihydrolase [Planctomycetota bacterium]